MLSKALEVGFYHMVTKYVTMWPEKSIGLLYSKLYGTYGKEPFTLKDVSDLIGNYQLAKVYMYRLRRVGWAYRIALKEVKFRLHPPEICVLQASGTIKNLNSIKQQEYCGLIGAYLAKVLKNRLEVKSVVLYGSVARGCARRDSDVDLLIVAEKPREIWDALIKAEMDEEVEEELEWLSRNGIDTHITILPMSVGRLKLHPFILLDIVDEGIVLYDDGTYEREAVEMRKRLKQLGAKRVFLSEDEWYWDLKPSFKPGEVVEI